MPDDRPLACTILQHQPNSWSTSSHSKGSNNHPSFPSFLRTPPHMHCLHMFFPQLRISNIRFKQDCPEMNKYFQVVPFVALE